MKFSDIPPLNFIGLASGILMIILPFLGSWWCFTVGTSAADVEMSPFNLEVTALGQDFPIPLAQYLLFATKLVIVIAGALVFTGSLLPRRWWSNRFVKFGAMKVLWLVIGFVVSILLISILGNYLAPRWVSGFSLPYLSGSTTSMITIEEATATLPISMSLTGIFWIAVVVAALGVVTRIYHGKLLKRLEGVVPRK